MTHITNVAVGWLVYDVSGSALALGFVGLTPRAFLTPSVRAFLAAFDHALRSETVAKWSKETDSPVDPMSGDELKRLIADQTALLTKYKDVIASKNE